MPIDGAPARGQQQLIRFRAADGFLINALLLTGDPTTRPPLRDRPVLLQVHGSLGHFLARGTPRLLPHALDERGLNLLLINTRLAGCGQISGQGIFPDTSKDIEAAVEFLTDAGFEHIFVLGYSLVPAWWPIGRRRRPTRRCGDRSLKAARIQFPSQPRAVPPIRQQPELRGGLRARQGGAGR